MASDSDAARGAVEPFTSIDLPLPDRRDGKVRTSYSFGAGRRLFVTTDRLSAFDRVLAGVPYKGQVLNQLAAWWFHETRDIVANHVIDVPDPNVLVARAATPLPVEVVVRGYLTGVTDTSMWRRYESGQRTIDGHVLPEAMCKNTPFPGAIVTPTTKGSVDGHDVPLSCDDVVRRDLVTTNRWRDVQDAALALFARGQELAAEAGLVLADTKYEFGYDDVDQLLLIDEVHTPDSSRYWIAATYDERLAAGEEPESLDKEFVRLAFAATGYRGDGEPPALPGDVWAATSTRYIESYERLTGQPFRHGEYPVAPRVQRWLHDHLRETGTS
ncbi:MAG: phosphoribosylaminoimidazolesuccinocarboxamide synthase [Actinomycetota bacterium]|nr:phosphoribosylaminoimidazolesuccinocarboxamide synthase [Actinomycetota bacterium]